MESVIGELAEAPWARPLVDDINPTGGLIDDNKAKLCELRLAAQNRVLLIQSCQGLAKYRDN
jgi:hypothetical protein